MNDAIEAALDEILNDYPGGVTLEKAQEGGLRSVVDRNHVRKRLMAAIAAESKGSYCVDEDCAARRALEAQGGENGL